MGVDLAVVATKATQLQDASEWLHLLARAHTPVLVAQNGLDHHERLAAIDPRFAPESVAPTAVYIAGRRSGDEIHVETTARLIVPDTEIGARVAEAINGTFISVAITDDITTALWSKLLLNAAVGALATLTLRPASVLHDQEAFDLALRLMEEAAVVARADGALIDPTYPRRAIELLRTVGGAHLSSIGQDRSAGRPTEWRERNQVIVDRAQHHGLNVPLNRAISTLMRLGEPSHHHRQ
jgi:2-dehydropantoate 2-reductase